MPKNAIGAVYVELGTEIISTRCESVRLVLGRSAIDVTALGEGWEDYLAGNVKRWGVVLGLYQDYTSSDVPIYRLLKHLANDSTSTTPGYLAFVVRPTSEVASGTNPQFGGNVVLDGDLDMLVAEKNVANKTTITLKGRGTPTFTDTSS
jgi:hypothetical protein